MKCAGYFHPAYCMLISALWTVKCVNMQTRQCVNMQMRWLQFQGNLTPLENSRMAPGREGGRQVERKRETDREILPFGFHSFQEILDRILPVKMSLQQSRRILPNSKSPIHSYFFFLFFIFFVTVIIQTILWRCNRLNDGHHSPFNRRQLILINERHTAALLGVGHVHRGAL